MHADKRGIHVNKSEIQALCEFASRDKERVTLSAIHIRSEGADLTVYATDGHRAVECSAVARDGAHDGEWSLGREFAVELGRLLTGTDRAVLVFGDGVQAVIEDTETGTEKSRLVWPSDGASTQMTIKAYRAAIALPISAKRVACMTLPASQLAAVGLVGKAAGFDVVDVYAPKLRTDPIVFRVSAAGNTWTGCIMPTRGDEETDEDKAERGVAAAVDGFRDVADKAGASVTLSSGGKSVTLKPRDKANGRKGDEPSAGA